MEAITIYDLNAMYEYVHHKLTGVWVNQAAITWKEWKQESERHDVDQLILYMLDPASKAIHIIFPEFSIAKCSGLDGSVVCK